MAKHKTKPKKKNFRIKFDEVMVQPFKTWIQVAIGEDVHIAANELAKVCGIEAAFPGNLRSRACYTVIPADDNTWKFITIQPSIRVEEIVHECFHVIVHLSSPDGRGDPITEASNECYAYTLEALVKDVLKAYKRLGGRLEQ